MTTSQNLSNGGRACAGTNLMALLSQFFFLEKVESISGSLQPWIRAIRAYIQQQHASVCSSDTGDVEMQQLNLERIT